MSFASKDAAFILCGCALLTLGLINPPTQTAMAATCEIFSISQITAGPTSTTSPDYAIDKLPKTSWDSNGKGSWIMPDLGKQRTICYVEINWKTSNTRAYDFSISISSDGSTWRSVYEGTSKLGTVGYERYDFTDTEGRWVKITVNGNQETLKNSIQELRVRGSATSSEPPEEPTADSTRPSVTIQEPTAGQSFPSGTQSVTISGIASDNVGVTLVKVSINGSAFRNVDGQASWSYAVISLSDGKSYVAKVKAYDAAGNTKTVQISFSIQGAVEEPPQSDKFYKATLNTYISEAVQQELFEPYITDADNSRLHVARDHNVTESEFSLVENLPHEVKGLELFTINEIKKYAPILKQKGYDYIDYNLESGRTHSGMTEFSAFVDSITTASTIVRGSGLDMHCSPANWKLREGTNIETVAPLCDELHFQFQGFQGDPSLFLSLVQEYSVRARAANPDIRLTVQLSTERPTAPGMTLLETFTTNWDNAKPYLDGVTIWWANEASDKKALTDFMAWFNQHGRQ